MKEVKVVLICIDDETDILNFGDGIKELTYGKEYKIIGYSMSKRADYVSIVNDKGYLNEYYSNRFVSLERYREIKLDKILNLCNGSQINKNNQN